MHTYAFILGRKYLLSVAEILSLLENHEHIADITSEALIATFPEKIANPREVLSRLGGTIKIVEIFSETNEGPGAIPNHCADFLTTAFAGKSNKLNYGLSVYSFAEKGKEILKKSLLTIKKSLKSANLKSRFINKDFKNPESAAIKGENLINDGAELVAIKGHHKLFIGKTVALQDFENYSKRDYDRPARDAHLGMLPPKLAQIMINLGGVQTMLQKAKATTFIYDPFCGIGTVLSEGLLMGLSVVGSDINPEVVEKTKKNIAFTIAQKDIFGQTWRTFMQDATQLTKADLPEKISAVITESWLGPALTQFPTPENMRKTHTNVQELLKRFFQSIVNIIPSNSCIVMSLPVYRTPGKFSFVPNIVEIAQASGFKPEVLIPKNLIEKFTLKDYNTRDSLIYDRPDQIVGREIWKFIKK